MGKALEQRQREQDEPRESAQDQPERNGIRSAADQAQPSSQPVQRPPEQGEVLKCFVHFMFFRSQFTDHWLRFAGEVAGCPWEERVSPWVSPRVSPAWRYLAAPRCICSTTLLMLKLPACWRGGNSLNVESKSPTATCAGTRTNTWSMTQSQYVFDVMSARS
jgi:hypothetical protein